MEMTTESLVQLLFKVLFVFMIINMVINFILLLTRQKRIYKLLALYWPSVLFVFVLHSIFQTGDLNVALGYSGSFLSLTVFSMIGFEVLGRKFPLKKYLLLYLASYPLTILLHYQGYGFTAVAMPFAVATAIPLLHTFFLIFFKDRKKSTKLQKILGVFYLLTAVHAINFALFRMDPGAQLWGWLVAYALYDSLAILLPSIALEEANMSENERLQQQVNEKTAELNNTLQEKESLLKVVLHDISSPLMTLKVYLSSIKSSPENERYLDRARKSQTALEDIILEVKSLYGKQNRKERNDLKPVGLEECFRDVQFIYSENLQRKNINLVFKNELGPETKVLADQTTLTHSVLSNLVSNGLKFSYPNSTIEVIAREKNSSVVLEVKDRGPGMSSDIIKGILLNQNLQSSEGTSGEIGSGFGLSIVKSFVDSYGGQIEFDSKFPHTHPQEHGTSIRITLDRA